MYLAMNTRFSVCFIFAGLWLGCSGITLTTNTKCILVTSAGVQRQALCPGQSQEVDKNVEIFAGFRDNSKNEPLGKPLWQQSFVIEPKIKIEFNIPGYSQDMKTAYWGDDNCLYANIQMYPSWFIFVPPVFLGHNNNDQQIGCATAAYVGNPIDNPWALGQYGTDVATPANPSRLTGGIMDHLRNPNHEYYKDFAPLNPNSNDGKKSDADTSPSDLDLSLFDDPNSLGPAGADSLFALDPPDDSSSLNNIAYSTGGSADYGLFSPSGDGTFDLGTATVADNNAGTDLFANAGSGTDLFASTGSGTDLLASTDSGTDVALNDNGLFTRKRLRRSSPRDFRG